jgi:ubiquinol-cytochrome c reductase cytochrome c subunit
MACTAAAVVLALCASNSVVVTAAQNKKPGTESAAAAKTPSASSEVGDATRGKELYVKNGCYECHGYLGQGGSYTGPRIAPDPLPWEAIAAFIRNPPGLSSPANKDSAMPVYTSKLISDKDVQDICAYLKSVPPGVDMKNIPTYKK